MTKAEMKAYAERYQWLRDEALYVEVCVSLGDRFSQSWGRSGYKLDEKIDEYLIARRKRKGK